MTTAYTLHGEVGGRSVYNGGTLGRYGAPSGLFDRALPELPRHPPPTAPPSRRLVTRPVTASPQSLRSTTGKSYEPKIYDLYLYDEIEEQVEEWL